MQRDRLLRIILFLILQISTISAFSQDHTNQNWWFGNQANGIQFSQPSDIARLVSRPTADIAGYGNAGGAVASDPVSGGLSYYTDGVNVYDATHRLMPDGTALGGNASGNQPAVTCLIPGQTNRYYIITNDATSSTAGQLRSTIVDMSLPGNNSTNPNLSPPPLGNVEAATKATLIPGLGNESEAMIIIRHSDGTQYWLITQVAGTTDFKVSTINATGVITAGAATRPAGATLPLTAGQFAYDSVNNKLAVAPVERNRNVMIYDFDETTGTLTFDQSIANSAVTASTATVPVIYDVEWSNTGEFLYVSRRGETGIPGLLLQYDLVTPNASVDTIAVTGMARSYGLQLAPDSSVYHIYQATVGGPFLVGRITEPDTVASQANYELLPFGAVDFNATQFPAFLVTTPPVMTLDFQVSGTCANAPSVFFPTVEPPADSLRWDFGDGNGSNGWSPSNTYTAGGTFDVTLTAFVGGDSITSVIKQITITDFSLQLTLVQDTTACSCELVHPKQVPPTNNYSDGTPCRRFALDAEASGPTGAIQWFGPSGALAGMNTLTLSPVDSAGFYYVTVQDPNGSGCVAYAGVNIHEYGVDDPRSNVWHFGNNAGLNFNADFIPSTGVDPIPGPVVSSEGVATISDQNGQAIFSTNGEQVWDNTRPTPQPLLTVPPGLGGSQDATQSSFIIPHPSDPTLFYIFVTQEIYPQGNSAYELRYAMFDLKLGTSGQVVDPDPATPEVSSVLFSRSTERITGNEGWLIVHEYGNNNFRAYPITGQGIGSPVISSIGSDHSLAIAENGQGYMKLSGATLGVALSDPGVSNVVEIFDFDNATGAVTNFRQIDLEQPDGQVYGIEIAGPKLFATTRNSTVAPSASFLHEFSYDSALGTYIRNAAIPPQAAAGELGAIERGPDGTTYVAINGSTSLGTLQVNGIEDQPSTFTEDGQPLSPTVPPGSGSPTSTLGLPNFIQSIADPVQAPSINVAGACEDVPTQFTGSGTNAIDTLTWFFGDGTSEKGVNLTQVEHTYSTAGSYNVSLRISNRCVGIIGQLDTVVVINPTPLALTSPLTICDGTEVMEATPANNPDLADLTFLWSTGDTLRAVVPPGGGIFNVTVTSSAGCTADGEWFVVDNRPQLDLGPDQTICENTAEFDLDAQNPNANHTWTRNGVAAGNGQTITVPTTPPGAFEYKVRVVNPFNNCSIEDSVTYIINPAPVVNPIPNDPATCGGAGSIDLDIQSGGLYSYAVSGRDFGSGVGQQGPILVPVPNLRASAYNVSVTDEVTGCNFQQTVGLNDQTFTVNILRSGTCTDANDQIPIEITTNAGLPYTYRILTGDSTIQVESGTGDANPFVTDPVFEDNYVVEVTSPSNGDPNACVASSPATDIFGEQEVPINGFTIDECSTDINADPVTIVVNASPPNGFLWSSPTASPIIPPNNTATLTANPPPGIHEYNVILFGDNVTSCDNDTTFVVNVGMDPLPDFEQSSPCDDAVTLSATPSGPYVYQWYENGTAIAGGQQILVLTTGNFRVEAQNTITGCIVQMPADKEVVVLGELTVEISNPQPCEGTDYGLTADINQQPVDIVWRLNNEVLAGETNSALVVTDDSEGLFKITVTRTAGTQSCVAADSVQIVVAPTTPGLLPDEGIICPDEANSNPDTRTVTLDAGPGFIAYQWYLNDVALPDDTLRTIEALQVGTYSVDLVNIFNCPSGDRITLVEECDPQISGPNAFRPGGLNREFLLFTFFIDPTAFEIYIFNRWGEMVFYDNDPAFRWNGGLENDPGRPLPPGTYSYLVKYKRSYRPRGMEEYRGGVVLLR